MCEEAGVDRDVALSGMHKVRPDLGALIAWNLDIDTKRIQFINGMAANDPVSTLQIWKFIIDRYPAEGGTCVFFNSRDDRPLRTRQMIELALKEIKLDGMSQNIVELNLVSGINIKNGNVQFSIELDENYIIIITMKKFILMFATLCLITFSANAQTKKGTVLLGAGSQFSGTSWTDWQITPKVGYFIQDGLAIGAEVHFDTDDEYFPAFAGYLTPDGSGGFVTTGEHSDYTLTSNCLLYTSPSPRDRG